MPTVTAQRTAIETALTAATIKNTSDPTLFTAQQSMVVIFSGGSGNLTGVSFKTWAFRIACCVPLGPKTGVTALTTLTLAVLAVAESLSGCAVVGVGPESLGITEGGVRYLAADVNVVMYVTI